MTYKPPPDWKVTKHGTPQGFWTHRRLWETPCEACTAAEAERFPHGTEKGYHLHRSRGEDPCDPCKAGHAATVAARRARQLETGNFTHGASGWDVGCRCPRCRRGHKVKVAYDAAKKRRQRARASLEAQR